METSTLYKQIWKSSGFKIDLMWTAQDSILQTALINLLLSAPGHYDVFGQIKICIYFSVIHKICWKIFFLIVKLSKCVKTIFFYMFLIFFGLKECSRLIRLLEVVEGSGRLNPEPNHEEEYKTRRN